MPRTSKLPLHPRTTFAASPIDRWRRAQYHRGMKRSTSCRAAQRAFVPLLCAALLAGCTRAKETQPAAAPEPEPSLRDILAAYRNDTPCHEATFIRELEQQDGSIVLLVMRDGTPELLPQSYAESATNLLLEDGSCKVGIPWQDRPAEWYAYPQHRCQSRFVPVRSNGSGGKWTYADTCRDGTLLAPAIFEKVHPFKEGLGAVQYKGNWYFINEEGKITLTLEPNYLPTGAFYNGICIVDGKKYLTK